MNQSTERWLPVPSYEGCYEVSDHGRVRSLRRTVPAKNGKTQVVPGGVLKQSKLGNTPYMKVALGKGRQQVTRSVHSLVLEAFVGPRPDGMEACHGFGGPQDNRLTNLRWDTLSENNYDMVRMGRHWGVNKSACPLGHALRVPNLTKQSLSKGHRSCLACSRARAVMQYRPQNFEALARDKYERIMSGEVAS